MSLEEFCKAIGVENRGSWDETRADSNKELVAFWHSISVNSHDRLNRCKFTHIQHPSLRYFALFLARGFLARDNNSACTGPMVYLLKCAKENTTCEYNLGVILARTLHLAVRRNMTDTTPIYAGAIATLIYEHIKEERGFDNNMGRRVEESNLLDFTLTCRMEMSEWHKGGCNYIYKSHNGQNVSIRLPRADLFDRNTGKWTVEEVPPQEEPQNPEMQNYPWGFKGPEQGGYQGGDPSYYGGGSSSGAPPYDDGSESGGYDYHPGY